MSIAVVCLVSDILKADAIVQSLKMAGFENRNISLLMPDTRGVHDVGYEKHSKAPEGVSIGGALGLGTGAVVGWMIGAGMLAIPYMGAFIAAGPLMAALSCAAIGGAIIGSVGGLFGLTMPEYEAIQYDGKLSNGQNIFISVHTENSEQRKKAEQIFKLANARDVNCIKEEPVALMHRAKSA